MRGHYETEKSSIIPRVELRLAQADGSYVKVDVAEYLANPANDLFPACLGAARESRFSGQLNPDVYYTGAHHAMFVSSIVNVILDGTAAAVLGGMIHDLPEAFLRDLPTPVKKVMHFEGDYAYDAIHLDFDNALNQRFGLLLSPEDLTIIAKADALALRAEQTVFQHVEHEDTTDDDRACIKILAFIGASTQDSLAEARSAGLGAVVAMTGMFSRAIDLVVEQYQASMPLN